MPSRILLTGGKGQLAQEIIKLDQTIDHPDKDEMDFVSYPEIARYCEGKNYDIVIHAGAITNKFNENADEEYVQSNIIGTANIVLWAMRHRMRLVYISSDYVYPSERGDYTEESVLLPVNRYAKSKLGGEMAVQLYDESLIIRTSFYRVLAFPKACTDQYTSRIRIQEAAKAIYTLSCLRNVKGIINLGSERKRSLFEIVKNEFNDSVEPCTRSDIKISYIVPPDSSLNTDKYYRMMKTATQSSKNQIRCRICNSERLHKYLYLGRTPLANSYVRNEDLSLPEFEEELALQVCLECGLSQLTRVVHPDLMFKNYLYVSSTTKTFQDHCQELATSAIKVLSATPGDLVLDIASNDGCLLSKFRGLGMNVLGVDPAENLAAEANSSGVPTLCTYWSRAVAQDLASRYGMPKIITATNVFAHVDDVHEFVDAVNICMARKGIFVIEFPYLLDFIQKNEFDTAYHEHLSYIAIHPVSSLMRMHGLEVFDVEYFEDIHGGTVRVYVCRANDYPVGQNVKTFMEKEEKFGLKTPSPYESFALRVLKNKENLRAMVNDLHRQGKKIWAYGASAKGNTLMNFFGIANDLVPAVIDDNPKKWGYYTPGSRMRITGIGELGTSGVDYLLLLAWNFQTEIIRRCKTANYKGAYIIPVPEATIIPDHS
jgi:dTDP-4-dehydrorhamnose reductase